MFTRLDHLVILVQDLNEATADYEGLGFRVTAGGEHADGLTRNALVPFRDVTYLELVSLIRPEDGRDNVWGWREFLPHEGLVDYCAASDGLGSDVERLRGLGFGLDGPTEGGRRLPGGQEIRWLSASISQGGRILPFLIEDVTPRENRVPGGSATDHPNGATGIRRLEISTPDTREASANLATLTGNPADALKLGACELVLTQRDTEQKAGPTAVTLSTDAPESWTIGPPAVYGSRSRQNPKAEGPFSCIIRWDRAYCREGRT